LALGIFLLILGGETLVVDNFVMADGRRVPRIVSGPNYQPVPAQAAGFQYPRREIRTKDWMPWSLLAAGAITVMYTCSLHSSKSGE
jgi:hypothetical protein